MSMSQYGLPSRPAGEDIDQDTLVKLDGSDEWVAVSAPDGIDNTDTIGVADVSVEKGEELSPKRGQLVDYLIASESVDAGQLLEPASGGEVAVYDDGTTGHVAIGRAASDAEADERVRIEFSTIYDIAT